ncbi:hypothetical protein HYPSUDRAFT_219213 [Hypholoma sublateritium FD-334 SS-4]|uniref:Uncharacterized protein n=1 Tax=Hypholoma sublateritium (strain FD-334 SS-4) TaxID=945553 RepID=A0A0D2NJX4_HYPSF|nr:hypothetical protein HYPSUDRAFT_219213 [Hypholoma sublateritium FD-334 SS-4]
MSESVRWKSAYGFHWRDYTYKKLQRVLGLEEDDGWFQKIVYDMHCIERKHFTIQPPDDGEEELFDLVKAELKGKEPILFGGSHGDRCLSFIFGVIRRKYCQQRCDYRRRSEKWTSKSAVPATQSCDRDSSTAAPSMGTSSQPIARVPIKTSVYHSPRRTKDTRKKLRPVVLLRKKYKNIGPPEEYGALTRGKETRVDSVNSDDRLGFDSRESSTAQYFAESERSASSASALNGYRGMHSGFESVTQSDISSPPPSLEENRAAPSTLPSMFQAGPQVKGPRRVPRPLDAPGYFHDYQPNNRPVNTAGPAHEQQYSALSGSQSTNSSSPPLDDYFDYFNTLSPYGGPRWEPREPDPSLSSSIPRSEKLQMPVTETPKPSSADPSSSGTDRMFCTKAPTERESGIAGIHRFLSKCHPPMMQHILPFVNFGCTTTEYLRAVSTWSAEQRHKLLVKILQAGRGGAVSQMDIAVLENHFETYFMDDDV